MNNSDVDKIQEIANALASNDSQISYGIAVANTILHWKQEQMIEKAIEFIKQHNGNYFRAWLDDSGDYYRGELEERFYDDFKKVMEGEEK